MSSLVYNKNEETLNQDDQVSRTYQDNTIASEMNVTEDQTNAYNQSVGKINTLNPPLQKNNTKTSYQFATSNVSISEMSNQNHGDKEMQSQGALLTIDLKSNRNHQHYNSNLSRKSTKTV